MIFLSKKMHHNVTSSINNSTAAITTETHKASDTLHDLEYSVKTHRQLLRVQFNADLGDV